MKVCDEWECKKKNQKQAGKNIKPTETTRQSNNWRFAQNQNWIYNSTPFVKYIANEKAKNKKRGQCDNIALTEYCKNVEGEKEKQRKMNWKQCTQSNEQQCRAQEKQDNTK